MPPAETRVGPTAGDLVAEATARLRRSDSPTPRLDAELLVAHAFGRDRTWLLAHPGENLDEADARQLEGWIGRRAEGEPIAYIRGFKDWFSLRVATDRRALIPRPETELLVEATIRELVVRLARDQQVVRAWEVGTGSGALAIAVGVRFRTALTLHRVTMTASDISSEALELASENLRAHGLDGLVTLACGDLLEPAGIGVGEELDLVIANLPYLPSREAAAGTGSLGFEPRIALDGGADGTDLVRQLLRSLPGRLAADGVALLEFGSDQERAIRTEAAALRGGWGVEIVGDLAGLPRVARIVRGGSP